MATKLRVTKEGHERLQAELEHEYERLEEAARILRETAGFSDDLDDSGLEDAKREKGRIEERIDDLEDQLNRAEIIEEHETEQIDLGSYVTLKEGKETFDVQVVSSIESGVLDDDIPRVSDESPLGSALMGHKVGDKVKVEINGSTSTYTVKKIA